MNFTFFKHGTELESTFKIKTGSKNYAKVINFKTELRCLFVVAQSVTLKKSLVMQLFLAFIKKIWQYLQLSNVVDYNEYDALVCKQTKSKQIQNILKLKI